MNNTIHAKKLVGTLLITIITGMLLIPFVRTLILSFQNFHLIEGMFGSPGVGTEHFQKFFQNPEMQKALSNTIGVAAIGTVVGVVYVFLSSASITGIKNQFVKGLVALVFAIPAIVPIHMLGNIISLKTLSQSVDLTKFCIGAFDGLRIAGLFAFVAFFLPCEGFKSALKCMLMFVAVKFTMLLSSDFLVAFNLQTAYTQSDAETLSTLVLRSGIMEGNYSGAAAIEVIRTWMQLVPAAIGSFLLVFMHRENKKEKLQQVGNQQQAYGNSQNPHQGGVAQWLFTIFAIIPIVLFVLVIIKSGSLLPMTDHPTVTSAYNVSWFVALRSAILVTWISFIFALLARNTFGGVGFVALILIFLTGNNLISNYILFHDVGVTDKIIGTIFYNLNMVPVFAIILTCATYRERSWKKDLAAFIVCLGFTFAYFWGEFSGTLTMITDPDLHSMSYLLLRILKEAEMARAMAVQSGTALPAKQLFSTVPYIVIPVITVAVGFLVGACFRYHKKEKIPACMEQVPQFPQQEPIQPQQAPVSSQQEM